jgi:hypothetical protein
MSEKNKAQQFILGNSKLNDAGTARTVNQSAYLEHMQEVHLITPETLKKVAEAEREFVTGAIAVATDDLAKLVTASKKAGEDPSDLSASVRISRPSGPVTTEVRAERVTTNPATGAKITHHGVVAVKVRSKTMIDPKAAEHAESVIGKLMA